MSLSTASLMAGRFSSWYIYFLVDADTMTFMNVCTSWWRGSHLMYTSFPSTRPSTSRTGIWQRPAWHGRDSTPCCGSVPLQLALLARLAKHFQPQGITSHQRKSWSRAMADHGLAHWGIQWTLGAWKAFPSAKCGSCQWEVHSHFKPWWF